MELAALILSGLGLLGGAIGFVVAQRARKQAAESERTAQAALQKSADAQTEAAAALARSADAQADATAALARSADSGDRIAVAVEQMAARSSEPDVDFVRVFEDSLNAKVEWAIEERAEPHSYRLRNTGNVDAEDVQITAIPAEHAALLSGGDLGNIDAGQVGIFGTSARLSLSLHRVAVSWVEGDTQQPMRAELNLP